LDTKALINSIVNMPASSDSQITTLMPDRRDPVRHEGRQSACPCPTQMRNHVPKTRDQKLALPVHDASVLGCGAAVDGVILPSRTTTVRCGASAPVCVSTTVTSTIARSCENIGMLSTDRALSIGAR